MNTHCTAADDNVKISREEMAALCKRFHIPGYHVRCFLRLANQGQIRSREFSRRLLSQHNYKRAYKALLEFLSRPIAHLFAYQREDGKRGRGMKSNRRRSRVKVSRENMATICERFRIPPYHLPCFLRLVSQGKLRSREFGRRLDECPNYQRAAHAIMELMSQGTAHYWAYRKRAG
jgi:hypothetical protein